MGGVKGNKGFTLIEILIVIGIIAILAAIVIIAINPAKQFAQARNTQRTANVNAILNAIGQRIADNKGKFDGDFAIGTPAVTYTCPTLPDIDAGDIPTTNIHMGPELDTTPAEDNLSCLVPTYIPTLPYDPSLSDKPAGSDSIGYQVGVDPQGRVTVCSTEAATEKAIPDPEEICVTR